MAILIVGALIAALVLPTELLRSTLSWLSPVPDGSDQPELVGDDVESAAAGGGPDDDELTVVWGLFTSSDIQHRLHALADELERLDHDPGIFAKAFHTTAARSAYEALLVDASRYRAQPGPLPVPVVDVPLLAPSTERREELDL